MHATEGRADQTEAGESQAEPGGARSRGLSHKSQLESITDGSGVLGQGITATWRMKEMISDTVQNGSCTQGGEVEWSR